MCKLVAWFVHYFSFNNGLYFSLDIDYELENPLWNRSVDDWSVPSNLGFACQNIQLHLVAFEEISACYGRKDLVSCGDLAIGELTFQPSKCRKNLWYPVGCFACNNLIWSSSTTKCSMKTMIANETWQNAHTHTHICIKYHGHFATNGFVFPLIRQMLQNTEKINFKPMNRS